MEKKIHSALPIYLAAAVFIVYSLIFPMHRALHLAIGLLLSFLALGVSTLLIKPKIVWVEPKAPVTGDRDTDQMIKEGMALIGQIKALGEKIELPAIKAQASRMESAGRAIFAAVSEKPEKARQLRRFINHYMPMSVKLLEHYVKLPQLNMEGNIQKTRQEIENNLELVCVSFEKELDSLYQGEALDISTDIDVLESLLAREGIGKAQMQ